MYNYSSAFLLIALLAYPLALQAASAPAPKNEQESIALGNGRFLIFSGSAGAMEYAYSVDLVSVDKAGVPHFAPLAMEEYSEESHSVSLSDGVAFPAVSYHFDKATDTLQYTAHDANGDAMLQYTYHFTGDQFTLQQVLMQKAIVCAKEPCVAAMPKQVYKAAYLK